MCFSKDPRSERPKENSDKDVDSEISDDRVSTNTFIVQHKIDKNQKFATKYDEACNKL